MEPSPRSCILVADDDPDILNLVQRRLTLDGHDVVPARDGDEARALVEEHHPDALVLDVVMPGQDGLELTRWAREEYEDKEIPIILLSARTQAPDIARGLAAGADEYLTKPFSRDDLRGRLQRLISEGQRTD